MNRSLTLLPHLGLYLNIFPSGGILKLSEGTITLDGDELSDTHVEYTQVLIQLSLLQSSKLRA